MSAPINQNQVVTSVTLVAGDNSAGIDVELGFAPSYIKIYNEDNQVELEFYNTLADGYGVKKVASGTTSELSSGAITPNEGQAGKENVAHGFNIGANLQDINDATETLHILALR